MTTAARDQDEGLEPIPQPGELVANKYRVEDIVGVGGMGVVLSARHVTLGQRVAIKVLRASEANRAEATARFLREGRAAAGLASDHVVRIHDVGTLATGAAFMVMELLRGRDLSAHLTAMGPLPIRDAVDYVLQVVDAMAEAHAFGIVHRDLKPSNLFLTQRSDGRAHVKVLDFGISKELDRGASDAIAVNLTSTRTVIGSPAYMSPEQIRDARHVDHRADVWAIGLILYELLSGQQAFAADTLPAVCAAIAADTPAPLRQLRAEVPPELEAIVIRCLEKDPARRFQSVRELGDALVPFGPPQPDTSRPPVTTALGQGAAVRIVTGSGQSAPPSPEGVTVSSGERERITSSVAEATLASASLASVGATTARDGASPGAARGPWAMAAVAVGALSLIGVALWFAPPQKSRESAAAPGPSATQAPSPLEAAPAAVSPVVLPEVTPVANPEASAPANADPSANAASPPATASAATPVRLGAPHASWPPATAKPAPPDAAAPVPDIRLER